MDDSSSFLMEKLRAKGGTYRSFKEYAKSLRMTLMEKRYAFELSEKNYLQECLDLLQQNILVSTLPAIIERLEVISRHLGLKFVSGPSRLEWFISSDMFYVEVVLETNGHVKDVKIHHDGTGERQSCEELKMTLEKRDFKDFTLQLEGLISIYNLNADQKVKSKAFSSLQYLESDILQLSDLQCSFVNDPFHIIHKSDVGLVQKRRGGHPMKIIYFISPYDLLDITKKTYKPLTLDLPETDYSVSLCLESSSTNKLQTQNLVKVIKSEKMDENTALDQPTPLFEELSPSTTNLLPACFVMKFKERMPICETLINQMREITNIEVTKIEGPHPILSLIKREIHKKYVECEEDSSIVTLPDQRHCYIMTNSHDLQAYIVQSVPFSHPSHVSKILPLLRQQALFNSFIASCIRPKAAEDTCDKFNQNFSEVMHCDSEYTNGFGLKLFGSEDFKSLSIFNESPQKLVPSHITMFEVMPLSLQQITVSFEHPIDETLITAELDLSDISDLRCNISMASEDSNTSVSNAQECAGHALQRSFSIPVTMRVLIRLWESQTDTSDEEDLNESSTNNDVADLNENAENNIESENNKQNDDCPPAEFNSGVTIKIETSDSCENSLDGFSVLTSRSNGAEFGTNDIFAVPNPSLRYQQFDAEMLPPPSTSSSYTEAQLPFLDNANEQPMFEPKNDTADLMENSFFESKSSVTDLFTPKGQRMNDCEIIIDSSSDSEPSENAVAAAAAAAALAAACKEVAADMKDPSPGSNSSLEFSALTETDVPSEKPHDFDLDHGIIENIEDVQQFLKLTESKIPKSEDCGSSASSFASSIVSDLSEGKSLVSPSVSITPVTTATPASSSSSSSLSTQQCNQNLQNVLNSMCLERRPGIDVSMTPFASSPPSLPASLTITPISVKETSDDRIKERKSQKMKNSTDDRARLEKKKKRKHDDSPMGPPEKIPAKSDPLSRPVSVSIKPTGGEVASPRSTSPCNAQRKFTVSPTQSTSLSVIGKISPNSSAGSNTGGGNNVKSKSQSGVGSMSGTSLTSSPKMGITTSNVSPKHSITSPKNMSSGSSGKPSMSALKSVVTSPSASGKSNNELKSKSHKDASAREYKEKKNSSSNVSGSGSNSAGHQSPKPKSSNVKLNKMDCGKLSAVIDRLTNSKTEDNCNKNGNGKSGSSSVKEVKCAAAQSADVKSGQSLVKGSQEYMIKHHDDGIKMTFNRRTRDSSASKTGSVKNSVAPGNDSPKYTGTKQSVNASGVSSIVCKKSTASSKPPTSGTASGNKVSSSSSGGGGSVSSKHSSKSSSSSSKSKSNHSPKGSHTFDPNRKEKVRPPKTHSDKSMFSSTPKRVSPSTQGELSVEADKLYKPPYQTPMVYGNKPLDTKFQIPKISDRNKMSGGENEPKKSSDVMVSADADCAKDILTKTDASPIKIPFTGLEERGILIEAAKNTNLYESSKSKSASLNENSLDLISNTTSQHQIASNCSMAGVQSSDSIKLNL